MGAILNIENDIAVIELDNGKVNAANHDVLDAINAHLNEAEAKAKAVVLYGGAGKFCGGFDLNIIKSPDVSEREILVSKGGELIIRLFGFPKPLIVAADGHGIALGALMLLAGDYRFGAANAKYGLNETAIGMTLPPWGLALAKERLHSAYLTESIILAKIYNGECAQQAGFLDSLTEQGQTLEAALNAAEQIKTLPTYTVADVKLKLRAQALSAMKS